MLKFINKYFVFCFLFIFLNSCTTTGHLKEKTLLSENMNSYKEAFLFVSAKDPANTKLVQDFQKKAFDELIKAKIYNSVVVKSGSNSDLEINLNLVQYKKGSTAAHVVQVVADGERKGVTVLKFDGQLIDKKTKEVLGTFELSGNSGRSSDSTLNFPKTVEEQNIRAIDAASEHLVKFLKEKKK